MKKFFILFACLVFVVIYILCTYVIIYKYREERKRNQYRTQVTYLATRIYTASHIRCNIDGVMSLKLADLFLQVSKQTHTSARLLAAMSARESCYTQEARGQAQEIGLMQIKKSTARLYGYDPSLLHYPYWNITIAANILAKELKQHSLEETLRIYNQGSSTNLGSPYSKNILVSYMELQ